MKSNNGKNVNLKPVDPFLKKFEGRYEKLGAGGIKKASFKESIEGQLLFEKKKKVKQVRENPITERKKNQKMFSIMMNHYNIALMEDYKRIPSKKINNINNTNNLIKDYQFKPSNNPNDDSDIDDNDYNINNDNDYNINNYNNNNDMNIYNNNYNNNLNINNNINYNNNIRHSPILKNKKNIPNTNNIDNNYSNKNINNNYPNKNGNNLSPKLNHNNSYPTYDSINSNYDSNNNNYINYNNDYEMKKPNIIENERFYKPYSLKQYKNIMEDYKSDKFGGLGKNMDKAWKEREKKINKVKKFENSVVKNFNKKIKDFNYKRVESPQKMQLMKIGEQIMNSKRYAAQKYGKRVKLNKVRDKIKNDKLESYKMKKMKDQEKYLKSREFERRQKDEDMVNIYDNVIQQKKDNYNYMEKLMQIKSSLI